MDFAYFFARFVHFYHMTDDAVMCMPIKRFWSMQSSIDRICAHEDMRRLSLLVAAQSSEGAKEQRQHLEEILMPKRSLEEKLDEDGWEMLKQMAD